MTNFLYERYTGKMEFVPGTDVIKGRCVVCAHEHVKPAKASNGGRLTSPKALVILRNIRDDNILTSLHHVEVKITFLPLLRIGTVIENGYCIGYSESLVSLKTELNQNPGYWRHVTKADYLDGFNSNYPVRKQNDSRYIEFTHQDGYKVLIPCLTYFSSCYGFSAELKRILATYDWSEVCRRICGPIDGHEHSGKLVVHLPKKLSDNDATFVAHALYDRVAQRAAKGIYSQIQTAFDSKVITPVFLEVAPWFTGEMQVELKGVWILKNVFLGLAFEGISEPDGERILLGRANSSLTEKKGDGPPTAWKNALVPKKNLPLVVIKSEYDPAPDEPSIEIVEPRLRILGERRAKTKIILKESKSSSGTKLDKPSSGIGTSGERQPGDNKIGPINQIPNLEFKKGGTLLGMWQASRVLHLRHPQIIRNVRCYLMEEKYRSSDEPLLISLNGYTDAEKAFLNEDQQRWIYSSYSQRKVRGLLVIQFDLPGISYVIVEVERKHGSSFNEEHIRGLIFEKSATDEFDDVINKLKARLRLTCGNINKCTGIFKKAFIFNHPASKSQELKCQKAIVNAFNKVGVDQDFIRIFKSGLSEPE
ncbi:hypothetical protein [Rheinheimera gaetbuli]